MDMNQFATMPMILSSGLNLNCLLDLKSMPQGAHVKIMVNASITPVHVTLERLDHLARLWRTALCSPIPFIHPLET
jgi:hypothetical protein